MTCPGQRASALLEQSEQGELTDEELTHLSKGYENKNTLEPIHVNRLQGIFVFSDANLALNLFLREVLCGRKTQTIYRALSLGAREGRESILTGNDSA